MAYTSPTLNLMIGAVKKTASALGRDFNELEHLQNSVHGNNSFALRSYEKAHKILQEELSKIKSGYSVVRTQQDCVLRGNCFTICPIDGFDNFAHGNATFAISAALIENNIAIASVIYSPINDELFFAEKGSGAFKEGFRNHERLRVAACKNAERALIATNTDAKAVQSALSVSTNLRISGSTSLDLAYVAAGKIDVAIAVESDFCALSAGTLLVKEAGGYVFAIGETDTRSENLQSALYGCSIFATNEALKQKIADATAK
ncbi:MAG: inositol monophosphatase family protein [Alphaproteobacteria bacterium]|nr:inositol monophosphatase family protein [Alphaproteobacteria bacterium]